MKLHKTTIVIWSEYDGMTREIVDLAQAATDGDAYCSKQKSELIEDPPSDPDAPDMTFFDDDDED